MALSTPVTVTTWATFQVAAVKVSDDRSAVTTCATFQVAAVKVSEAGETVAFELFDEESPTDTSPVGCDLNAIVKVLVPPASATVRLVGVTVKPTVSLSTVRADTLVLASAL